IKNNTFSVGMLAYLWLCIESNKNLIFAGGTASGKTSSLNAVSFFIPPMAKIVSIEDTREITLYHENWIPAVTRNPVTKGGEGEVTMFDLLKAALRQRPEYILLGEVRGAEALTLFQAMNTGHTTYSTIHAEDPQSCCEQA
ncbi:MAG: type II/IV secretion system ATPase subunit, partial [Candidatus Syntropharchaeales archaeon]